MTHYEKYTALRRLVFILTNQNKYPEYQFKNPDLGDSGSSNPHLEFDFYGPPDQFSDPYDTELCEKEAAEFKAVFDDLLQMAGLDPDIILWEGSEEPTDLTFWFIEPYDPNPYIPDYDPHLGAPYYDGYTGYR